MSRVCFPSTSTGALREDRELVLAAVAQDGDALRFVAPDLRQDPEILGAAVRQNAQALCHLAESVRGKELILNAVVANGHCLEYALNFKDWGAPVCV